MKRRFLLTNLLLIIFCISAFYLGMTMKNTSDSTADEWFLVQQRSEYKQWDIDKAEKIRKESYAFLGGVTHNEKFLLLLKQAFMGDKNALLQVAIIRLEDKEVTSDPDFYGEGSKSQVDIFINRYHKQLVSDNGIVLEEPSLLRKAPWAMIKYMADSGHPASSDYFLSHQVISPANGLPLTNEARQMGLHYLENLLEIKEYDSWARQKYSDFILFDNGRRIDYNKGHLRSLNERLGEINSTDLSKAIEMNKDCAMQGDLSCAIYLAEAYAEGVGIEQDWVQAYAWARVVNFVHYPYLEEARGDQTSIIASMNKLALAVIKEGDEHLSAAQKLAAQKIANQLIDQISFS